MKNGIRGWRRRRKEETIGEEQNWRERDKHRSRASWCPNKEGEGETGNTEWCRMRKKEKMKEGKKKEGRVASEWLLNKGLSCSLQRLVKLSYLLHLLFACLICFASSSSRYCPSCLSHVSLDDALPRRPSVFFHFFHLFLWSYSCITRRPSSYLLLIKHLPCMTNKDSSMLSIKSPLDSFSSLWTHFLVKIVREAYLLHVFLWLLVEEDCDFNEEHTRGEFFERMSCVFFLSKKYFVCREKRRSWDELISVYVILLGILLLSPKWKLMEERKETGLLSCQRTKSYLLDCISSLFL